MAALYHFKICRAILVGFRNQLRADGVRKDGFVGMLEAGQEREEIPATVCCYNLTSSNGHVLKKQIDNDKTFRDGLAGQLLDPALVTVARKKELQYFDGKDVWELKPVSECRRITG